jgi:hypothetical protein
VLFDQECLVEELIRLHLSSDLRERIDWDLNGMEHNVVVDRLLSRGEQDGVLEDEMVELELLMLGVDSMKC